MTTPFSDAITTTAQQLSQQRADAEQRLDTARARLLRLRGQVEEAENTFNQALAEYARLSGASDLAAQIANAAKTTASQEA